MIMTRFSGRSCRLKRRWVRLPPAAAPADNPLAELKAISQNKIREHAIEAFSRMKGEKAETVLLKLKDGVRLKHTEQAVERKRAYTIRAKADFEAWLGDKGLQAAE